MTQAEWMALHVEELADAIAEDGKMCGPKSEPLLLQCIQYTERALAARWMLRKALEKRGIGHLLTSDV